jgi:hypothetical protein
VVHGVDCLDLRPRRILVAFLVSGWILPTLRYLKNATLLKISLYPLSGEDGRRLLCWAH